MLRLIFYIIEIIWKFLLYKTFHYGCTLVRKENSCVATRTWCV